VGVTAAAAVSSELGLVMKLGFSLVGPFILYWDFWNLTQCIGNFCHEENITFNKSMAL